VLTFSGASEVQNCSRAIASRKIAVYDPDSVSRQE
jgi:hypothetical protein